METFEALIDPIEAVVNPIEAVVHPVEAAIYLVVEVIEALVGPAISHRLHSGTVTLCLQQNKARRQRECNFFPTEAADRYLIHGYRPLPQSAFIFGLRPYTLPF
jgi:hypothetical protein